MKHNLNAICKHCGKRFGLHKTVTNSCPTGTKTRIGYTTYSKDKTFEEKIPSKK